MYSLYLTINHSLFLFHSQDQKGDLETASVLHFPIQLIQSSNDIKLENCAVWEVLRSPRHPSHSISLYRNAHRFITFWTSNKLSEGPTYEETYIYFETIHIMLVFNLQLDYFLANVCACPVPFFFPTPTHWLWNHSTQHTIFKFKSLEKLLGPPPPLLSCSFVWPSYFLVSYFIVLFRNK